MTVTHLPVASNVVELEILPLDPAWLEKTLRDAVAVLDSEVVNLDFFRNMSSLSGKKHQEYEEAIKTLADQNADRLAAARTLRFLGTEGAVTEMVRCLKGRDGLSENRLQFHYYLGLLGSPHRTLVVKEMEEYLDRPEHPVCKLFLGALCISAFFLEHPQPPPSHPPENVDETKFWQEYYKTRRELYEETTTKYLQRLASVVSRKHGEARAVSLCAIVETIWNMSSEKAAIVLSKYFQELPLQIAAAFHDLPISKQRLLLDYRWKYVAHPAMVPVLRQVCETPQPTGDRVEDRDLRQIALRRLYELAPEEGRKLILEEIKSPHPRVGIEVLGLLPEETLPDLEEAIADNLENYLHRGSYRLDVLTTLGQLLERYASDSVSPRVKALCGDNLDGLKPEIKAPVLAYFLRTDSSHGEEMIERLFDTPDTAKLWLLEDVAKLHMSPVIEKAAIENLANPDPKVASGAVSILRKYGSAAAKEPLWWRYEEWHEQWKGREDELGTGADYDNPNIEHVLFERRLFRALIESQAWICDLEELKKLQELCITPYTRNVVRHDIERWSGKMRVSVVRYDEESQEFNVGRYECKSLSALKEKLAQFPKDTCFKLSAYAGVKREVKEQIFVDLEKLLKERGIEIEDAQD